MSEGGPFGTRLSSNGETGEERKVVEHRGVTYAVPNTDDGAWRWVIYPGGNIPKLAEMNAMPRPIYATRDNAVEAAKIAIDHALEGRLPKSKR
jgi:hypothetical protein